MVAALKVERSTVFWDQSFMGFGVRVYPSGGKVYVARAQGPKGKGRKHVTVGRHGVIGTAEARRRAASIIVRIKGRGAGAAADSGPGPGLSDGCRVR